MQPILLEDRFEDQVAQKNDEEEDAEDDWHIKENGIVASFVPQSGADAAPAGSHRKEHQGVEKRQNRSHDADDLKNGLFHIFTPYFF